MRTALPSSDYYERSVPMQDFQVLHHSRLFTSFARRSCLGYPQLTLCVGNCGLSVVLSFRYHGFSRRLCKVFNNHLAEIYHQMSLHQRFQTFSFA
jgi:hypothetical protein